MSLLIVNSCKLMQFLTNLLQFGSNFVWRLSSWYKNKSMKKLACQHIKVNLEAMNQFIESVIKKVRPFQK